jgi:hypothetical protein
MHMTRYCAPPDVIALLARDGLGWGHDVECGTLYLPDAPHRPGLIARLALRLTARG